MLMLVAAGVISFLGFVVLSALAPQMDGSKNHGAHALSIGGNGYSAIAELAQRSGLGGDVLRSAEDSGYGTLLILTPDERTDRDDVLTRIDAHAGKGKVLIVPSKWSVRPFPGRRGWVRKLDSLVAYWQIPSGELGHPMKWRPRNGQSQLPTPVSVDFGAPAFTIAVPQTSWSFTGEGMESVIDHPRGGMLLGYMDRAPGVYVLSEADLLNNQGMNNRAKADAALSLLTALVNYDNLDAVEFDVTLNGLGRDDRSLLRMAFTPPFLGITLCLIAAALFAGWQSLVRFGPDWRRSRAVALGKSALVLNAAELMHQAGKDAHGAGAYARNMRDAVAMALAAPPHLKGPELDAWLDHRGRGKGPPIGELVARMERADNSQDMLDGARALWRWRKDVMRDG